MSGKKNQDLALILRNLQVSENNRDLRTTRVCLFEVLQLSSSGYNISPALPAVVKLLAHSDVFIKRVAGEIMIAHAERSPEMVLLATNTLVHDCQDLNPVVRSLSLRTLTSLGKSLPSIDVLNSAVAQCLEDKSAVVKRNAALSCINLHLLAPHAVTESGLWDRLYEHLSDSNSGTVASCMCALENIFAADKGLVVSNKLGQHLINSLPSYTAPSQRIVLQFLLKHSPRKKSQVFEHLNDLDDQLSKSDSVATVLCAMELFCNFSQDMQKVRDKVFAAAWASLKVTLARERNEEIMASVLDYLNSTKFPSGIMAQDFKMFFCRDDDPPYLIKKKSCILSKLITSGNSESILQEFLSISKNLDSSSLLAILMNISSQMGNKPEVEGMLIKFFQQLFELENTNVTEIVVQILPSLTLSDASQWVTLARLIELHYRDIKSPEVQQAVLHLLHMHSSCFERAPDILEEMVCVVNHAENEGVKTSPWQKQGRSQSLEGEPQGDFSFLVEFKLSLLNAMFYVCLDRPAKVQKMLSSYMEICLSDGNRVIRDRALFLYGYLYSEVQQKLSVSHSYSSSSVTATCSS